MPTLFSRLNNRSASKPSRYGPAISSTDLALFPSNSPSSQDARELTDDGIQRNTDRAEAADSTANGSNLASHAAHDANVLVERSPNVRQHAERRQNDARGAGNDDAREFGAQPRNITTARMFKTLPAKPATTPFKMPTLTSHSATANAASTAEHPSSATPADFNPESQPPMYGYSPIGWDKQLDVPKVAELVLMCGEQIRMRGLTMPLIFSSMALDLSQHNVTSLIRAYLTTPQDFYGSESKFANPHDLAAVVKWALSRLGRVFPVPIPPPSRKADANDETILIHQRGFLEMDSYVAWAAYERNASYPVAAFSSFLDGLTSSSAALLVALFSLLSSTTSYSLRNGMTPSRLARLFGLLIFGVPEDESFERTYEAYVRVSNATEHLLLAYIRDMSTMEPLPTRLADHVRGYPNMLAADNSKPGRGVRGVPFTFISRSVRLYSVDLVQQSCDLSMANQSPEWAACCGTAEGIDSAPQLSDRYRKLINLRAGKRPKANAFAAGETNRHLTVGGSVRGIGSDDGRGATRQRDNAGVPGLDTYSSLADKAWGDFISDGFAAPDSTKLAFDLRESERKARTQERQPVQWSQFEESGFSFKDEGLASVLEFDELLHEDVKRWPEDRAELLDRLRKTNKAMPRFTYDTTPEVVSSPTVSGTAQGQWEETPYSRMDEVFPEVFADILLGNGWSNRDELTHRNANFAVVQYKSRPTASTVGSQTFEASKTAQRTQEQIDDRSDAAWFVVEEVVPAQYRSELEAVGRKKNRSRASLRNLTLFRKRKEGTAHTADQSFFDDVFRPGPGGKSKKLTLRDPASAATLGPPDVHRQNSFLSANRASVASPSLPDDGSVAPANLSSSMRLLTTLKSRASKRLRAKGASPILSRGEEDGTSRASPRPAPPPPPPKDSRVQQSASWDSVDFETRSLHDAEMDAFALSDKRKHGGALLKSAMNKAERRQSKDDSWLDIMVRANSMRSAGQGGSTLDRLSPSAPSPRGALLRSNGSGSQDDVQESARKGKRVLTKTVSDERSTSANMDIDVQGWSREDAPQPTAPPKESTRTPNIVTKKTDTIQGGTSPRNTQNDTSTTVRRALSPSSPKSTGSRAGTVDPVAPTIESDLVRHETEKSDDLSNDAASSSLRHLRSLPPRGSSSETERERARDERIEAAKQRARELRANLKPDSVSELGRKREERSRTYEANETESTLSPADLRNNLALAHPSNSSVLSAARSAVGDKSLSPEPSPRSSSKPRDDPFAKDRFSGRVASLTSRFGGTTGKSSSSSGFDADTSREEGSVGVADISTVSNDDVGTTKEHSRLSSPLGARSEQNLNASVPRSSSPIHKPKQRSAADGQKDLSVRSSSKGDTSGGSVVKQTMEQIGKPGVLGKHRTESEGTPLRGDQSIGGIGASSVDSWSPMSPSGTFNAQEPVSRQSVESSATFGIDADSIYPEDAASNFSRDTQPDEESQARTASMPGGTQQRPANGSLASAAGPVAPAITTSLFANLDQSPAMAGAEAAAAAAIRGSETASPASKVDGRQDGAGTTIVSILTPEQLRAEEKDLATAMPPGFSQRYQPGMPLSNVEEERESVLSGSNV